MGTGISQFSFRFSTELLKKPCRRRPSSRFNYNYIITIFNLLLLRALKTTVSHPSADRVKIPRQFAENPQVLSLSPSSLATAESFNLPILEWQHFDINYINITSKFSVSTKALNSPLNYS